MYLQTFFFKFLFIQLKGGQPEAKFPLDDVVLDSGEDGKSSQFELVYLLNII